MDQQFSAALSVVNSLALCHALSDSLSNCAMRTVEEVRQARLEQLIEEFGSLAELNRMRDKPARDSTLSQYRQASRNSKGGSPKGMGSDVARALERACGKEVGWMDTDPALWPFTKIDHSKIAALLPAQREQIQFGVLAAAALAGIDIQKRDGTNG